MCFLFPKLKKLLILAKQKYVKLQRRRPSFHLSIQKPQSSSLTNFEENSSTNYRSQDEKFLTAQNRNFGGAGDFEEEMMDFEPSYLVENLSSICPECVQKANNIIRP
uniref:Uncharacterized protein n=1 Tax=Romanomermis culicivorax TaxID=13658 RepID=A0A915HXJ6_ROMCU